MSSSGIYAKTFEVRDSMTFIPVLAVMGSVRAMYLEDQYLWRRAGWGLDQHGIYLFQLHGRDEVQYNEYSWKGSTRTMREAHKYIIEHWNELQSGDVIDVEYILGERTEPKISERLEDLTR